MIKFYDFLLSFFKPLIILVGKIHAPFSKKLITGKHYYEWRKTIEVGTVILTKTKGELSNIINPMTIKHAGIYVGNLGHGNIHYVLEATAKGVALTDLVTFLTTKDVAVGCKPTFIRDSSTFIYEIHEAAKRFHGVPYDYLFEKGGKAFYCFELAAACLNSVYPEIRLKCKEIVKNKKVYDHNTFLDNEFFQVIFDSRKEG